MFSLDVSGGFCSLVCIFPRCCFSKSVFFSKIDRSMLRSADLNTPLLTDIREELRKMNVLLAAKQLGSWWIGGAEWSWVIFCFLKLLLVLFLGVKWWVLAFFGWGFWMFVFLGELSGGALLVEGIFRREVSGSCLFVWKMCCLYDYVQFPCFVALQAIVLKERWHDE